MKTMLVTVPITDEHKAFLEEKAGGQVAFVYKNAADLTDEELKNADAIFGNVPAARLKACEQLTWLQLNSAGANEYVVPGVMPEGATLTCAVGAYSRAVSEHMVALTFAMIRRLGQYARNQVKHEWKSMGKITSVEDSTVLILGMGDIGGAYARKMQALGAYTIGIRRTNGQVPEGFNEQHTMEELDELLPKADIVAMVLPGSDATCHVMDERRIHLMKKGSYILNVGRGNAIDPDALKAALREGHLAAAAVDVTEPEPLGAEDDLWDFDNVILTPHVAGHFFLAETLNRIVRIAAENMEAWLKGEELTHKVNMKAGY